MLDLTIGAAAIDNFEAAIETHHYNFPNSLSICDDIKNINPKNLKKDLGHDIDLIIGDHLVLLFQLLC